MKRCSLSIHGERAMPRGPTRILQLWFALPEPDRWNRI